MYNLAGKTALVTGASQGIGRSIAETFHGLGARVIMIGRSQKRLKEAASTFFPIKENAVEFFETDLAELSSVDSVATRLTSELDRLDILVNCGGTYSRGRWEESDPEALDIMLRTNVAGPYSLTRRLLPLLIKARGDVVFVNSTITRSAGIETGQFKASQHALQAISETLRAEYNGKGIRVMSIYPGRTSTPRQERIFRS